MNNQVNLYNNVTCRNTIEGFRLTLKHTKLEMIYPLLTLLIISNVINPSHMYKLTNPHMKSGIIPSSMLETHPLKADWTTKLKRKIINVNTGEHKVDILQLISEPLKINVLDKSSQDKRKNVGLLGYLLETLERKKYKKNINEPFPLITRVDMVYINPGNALQELLLKFLEWFAFIATDVLFQAIWPL